MGQPLDGKALAAEVRADVAARTAKFTAKYGRAPGLDVVLVGEDPASVVYTRSKEKSAREVGMASRLHRMPAASAEADVLARVRELNDDPNVDGILVQLPLPAGVRGEAILDAIDPAKDVDGFHEINAGRLARGREALVPCTPRGCLKLLAKAGAKLEGANAVVVGRSNIVGRPMAELLLAASATVTIAHSKTRDLAGVCRGAEILIVAAGKAGLVGAEHVREGAIVIDVGIHRGEGGKLTGDVRYDEVLPRASFVTPVPGGVGPMTIACLLENTLIAAEARQSRTG